MKKLLSILLLVSSSAFAKETITIQFSAAANQPNYAPYLKTLEIANRSQNKYEFVMELKPGANGALALKAMDQNPQNRIATVAPAFVENAKQGLINEADYAPIAAQGDACWAVITNVGDTAKGIESLRGVKEITVGGTGYGNAAHITAIILGEKYGFKVRYIVYKSNFDALVNMAGGQPINMVVERVQNYQTFKEKNPSLQVLGINCPKRSALMPNIKTLREQGVVTPTIFMATVANVKMPKEKRDEISKILINAQAEMGEKHLLESADMFAPQFNRPAVSVEEFFTKRVSQMHYLTTKYKEQIDEARK